MIVISDSDRCHSKSKDTLIEGRGKDKQHHVKADDPLRAICCQELVLGSPS